MRAIVIAQPGGPEVLQLRDVPDPKPAAGEVLVRVRAAGLNRADLLQRQGRYPAPPGVPADIPGLEFAGDIADLGERTSVWKKSQRVFGIVAGGAQAEYLTIHERAIAEIPPNLDYAQAAAVPEVFITAHDALWKQAQLRPSEIVLIHAVGSGVGLAAVQLARAIGAIPYGTARTGDKINRAKQIGLEDGIAISGSPDSMADAVARWTGGRGIDLVLDLVGGPYVSASIDALAEKGRIMLVGTVAGGKAELPLLKVMSKRATIRGTVLRARPLEEKIEVTQAFAREVVPLLARGTIQPNLDSVFPMSDIAKAHQRLESNATFGKVVITIP